MLYVCIATVLILARLENVTGRKKVFCEDHCDNPCHNLNGDNEIECGACTDNVECHPGAETYYKGFRPENERRRGGDDDDDGYSHGPEGDDGYSDGYETSPDRDGSDNGGWHEYVERDIRSPQEKLDQDYEDFRRSSGKNHGMEAADPGEALREGLKKRVDRAREAELAKPAEQRSDAPIENEGGSQMYAEQWYVIQMRKRDADGKITGKWKNVTQFETYPLPVPQPSPRECNAHSCVLIEGDDACAERRPDCKGPRGHLRPVGEQNDFTHVVEWDARKDGPMDAPTFWREHMSKHVPLVIRGGAELATDLKHWKDAALMANCTLVNGNPWGVGVERQSRIVNWDRGPAFDDWTMCDFLEERDKPRWEKALCTRTRARTALEHRMPPQHPPAIAPPGDPVFPFLAPTPQ